MSQIQSSNERDAFILIRELAKALRIFQEGAVFCEDLTFTQFVILDHVVGEGRLPLSDLHALLTVEKSTTTRLVQPLVNQDLLIKERSTPDSRVVELVVTDSGKVVHEKVWDCISEFVGQLERQIPADEKKALIDSLKLFSNSLLTCCGKEKCC